MKLNREKLVNILNKTKSGISAKEVVVQATSFIFRNDRIFSFNDEIAVSSPLTVDFDGAVSANELINLVNKFKGSEISLSIKDKELLLVSGKAKAGLRIDTDIILPIDDINISNDWVDLPETFLDGLAFCVFSASKDSTKPILQFINVTGSFIESCDNYRISRFDMGKAAAKKFKTPILIPAAVVKDLITNKPNVYSVSNNWLHFKNEEADIIFSCRTVDTDFPDFSNILVVDGFDLQLPNNISDILDRGSVLSEDDRVTIVLEEESITIISENDKGWFEESSKCDYSGDEFEFSIVPKFLKSILNLKCQVLINDKMLTLKGENFIHAMQIIKSESK